jgi:hypothetical protein
VLPFAALFLTRITGFITLPLLLVALLWILVKRGERSVIGVGLGYIASYGVSFFWGLKYSTYYATGIYEGKLGITGPMLGYAGTFFALLAVVWVVVGGVCIAASNGRRILGKFVMRFGVRVTLVMLLFVALSALYRGYLLGFTDTFVGHRWLDTRWRMVGHGLESLEFLSLHTLAVMLSYGGAVAFLVGLVRVGKIGVRRASMGPVPILAAGFLGIFSVYPLATPYLYYFGRYLASELVPLGIICGAVAVDLAARRYHRLGALIRWGYFVVIFCSLLPSFVTRLTLREGKDFFDLVSCIDRSTPGRSVILVEKRGLPETPLVTPLRLSYRKPPFSFRFVDFDTAEKRRRLIDFFTARGYKVFLLTGQKRWRSFEDVKFMGRLSGDFRTIGGKRGQPRRIRRRGVTVDLYSLTGEGTVSPYCAGVMR